VAVGTGVFVEVGTEVLVPVGTAVFVGVGVGGEAMFCTMCRQYLSVALYGLEQ
jgi:hypothetical protein